MQIIIKALLLAAVVADQGVGVNVDVTAIVNVGLAANVAAEQVEAAQLEERVSKVVDLTFVDEVDFKATLKKVALKLTKTSGESAGEFSIREAAEAESIKKLLELYKTSIVRDAAPNGSDFELVKSIIEARVTVLHKDLAGPNPDADNIFVDPLPVAEAAWQKIQEAHAEQNNNDLNWVQKIQKNKLTLLINANALAEQDDPLAQLDKSSIDDLEFDLRRDDQKYNVILDLVKKGTETEAELAERKAALLKQGKHFYKPSLWVSYDNEIENLVTKGPDASKKYINIPYDFKFDTDRDIKSTEKAKKDLEAAMLVLRDETCINFTEVNEYAKLGDKQQYIKFVNDQKRGCDEIIGRKDPEDDEYNHDIPQLQPFSDICQNNQNDSQNGQSTMGHYLMHILGFDNEHQRPDVQKSGMVVRDDFGTVGSEVAKKVPKLMGRSGHNDLKALKDNASQLSGLRYDKGSIMHWSNAFIGDENSTNIPHMRKGESTPFSPTDLAKIKVLYKCAAIELDLQADLQCHFILNEDGASQTVPVECLIKEQTVPDSVFIGESHVYVESLLNKVANVTLIYDIQAPVKDEKKVEDEVEDEGVAEDEEVVANEQDKVNAEVVDRRLAAVVGKTDVYGVTLDTFETAGAAEATFPEGDKSGCVVAKLAYNGEETGVLCDNNTKTVVGKCGEAVKFSYELDSTDLGDMQLNKVPSLKVSVSYADCEQHEAALLDEKSSASTITLTTVFLALF